MICVITEDSKSGCIFWKILSQTFDIPMTLISTYGKDRMRRCLLDFARNVERTENGITSKWDCYERRRNPETNVKEWCLKFTARISNPDCIIICCDLYAEGLDGVMGAELVKFLQQRVGDNCKVFVSTFGCIEALLLGFERFRAWVHRPRKTFIGDSMFVDQYLSFKVYNAFIEYCKGEREKDDLINSYTEGLDEYLQRYYEEYQRVVDFDILNRARKPRKYPSNLEQMVSGLIGELTAGTGFLFNKSEIGDCFSKDCKDIQCEENDGITSCQECHMDNGTLEFLQWTADDITCSELAGYCATGKQKLFLFLLGLKYGNKFIAQKDIPERAWSPDLPESGFKDVPGITLLEVLGIEPPEEVLPVGRLKFIPENPAPAPQSESLGNTATNAFTQALMKQNQSAQTPPKGQWVIEYENGNQFPLEENQVVEVWTVNEDNSANWCHYIIRCNDNEWLIVDESGEYPLLEECDARVPFESLSPC